MGKVLPWLLVVMACVNARHAEVNLANNPAGVDCYARCVAMQGDTNRAVDCVAACPGSRRDGGNCSSANQACVEHRQLSKGKTALVVVGGLVVFALIAQAGGG